jgi:hypothetical protein
MRALNTISAKSGVIGRVALGMALAATVLACGTDAIAKDKPAAAAPGKAAANSKEFATAAAPLQKTLAGAQPAIQKFNAAPAGPAKDAALSELKAAMAGAPPELAAAEVAIKTPGDRLLAGQWGSMVGSVLGDAKLTQHSLQNIIDSGLAPEDRLPGYRFQLGNSAYANKDYAGAIAALTPLVSANYSDNAAAEILADSYAKQGQPAQGLAAMKVAVDARRAAGGQVPDSWFTRANTIAYSANPKLANEGVQWAQMMVAANPTPLNWLGAAQLVRLYGNYGTQDSVDISRLMFRAGALNGKSKDVEREYVEYLQAADPRRLPGEVVKVADAAIAAGALRATDTFVADSLTQARGRVASDKASLPAAAKSAQASPTGVLAMATGDGFLSYGMDAQAEELYKLAIQKGGVDKDKATLRLGIAQSDAGKAAEAKATFGTVGGKSAPIAKLWSTYVDAKAAGKAS